MKSMLACCAVLVGMTTVAAADHPYAHRAVPGPALYAVPSYASPAYLAQSVPPAPSVDGHIAPVPEGTVVGQPMEGVALFHCVKYKDLDEMHPCAEPKIIAVKDPCACDNPCNCCAPPACVYIKICVPPCTCHCGCGTCEKVKSNKSGTRVTYDYGEYEVDVRVKDGYIEVDYQD